MREELMIMMALNIMYALRTLVGSTRTFPILLG